MSTKVKIVIGIISIVLIFIVAVVVSSRQSSGEPAEQNVEAAF